jgi:hypothetical protein
MQTLTSVGASIEYMTNRSLRGFVRPTTVHNYQCSPLASRSAIGNSYHCTHEAYADASDSFAPIDNSNESVLDE